MLRPLILAQIHRESVTRRLILRGKNKPTRKGVTVNTVSAFLRGYGCCISSVLLLMKIAKKNKKTFRLSSVLHKRTQIHMHGLEIKAQRALTKRPYNKKSPHHGLLRDTCQRPLETFKKNPFLLADSSPFTSIHRRNSCVLQRARQTSSIHGHVLLISCLFLHFSFLIPCFSMPGTERFGWGTDVDLVTDNDAVAMKASPIYTWLVANAANYGYCKFTKKTRIHASK